MKFAFSIHTLKDNQISHEQHDDRDRCAWITALQERYPLMRVGELMTPHGTIHTPAFVTVGTNGTVKGLTPEMISATGAEVVLANTYHLYLQPGEAFVKAQGGLGRMMGWHGPTMTDSGGFQAFSLGAALGKNITKLIKNEGSTNDHGEIILPKITESARKEIGLRGDIPESALEPAKIDANGVMFRSIIDGSAHYFTPQKSIQIQHDIGADIIVAFDECTSPHEPLRYQQEALDRTHRWAKQCLEYHHQTPATITGSDGNQYKQALYAVVQGGRHEALRKESAEVLSQMRVGDIGFDGYCIGGSFAKEDMHTAVKWVNEILPADKPRHLLGIGEPLDLFMAIEQGCDTFDCVLPTRNGRTGTLFTSYGKINISNAKYRTDMSPLDEYFTCPMLAGYTRGYLSHLFHAKEMLGGMIASVHNLYFLIELTKRIRQSIIDGVYEEFKAEFLGRYVK
jgi:queuine tRNA-ribosyltransferase